MSPEDWAYVEERIKTLGVACASRSHYFRLLVDKDRRENRAATKKSHQKTRIDTLNCQ